MHIKHVRAGMEGRGCRGAMRWNGLPHPEVSGFFAH
jgi:hypothetical protein